MNMFWNSLAARLARKPGTVERLIARSTRQPVLPDLDVDGATKVARFNVRSATKLIPYNVQLHVLLAADGSYSIEDPTCDDARDYRAIVLRGTYVEEDTHGNSVWRMTGSTHLVGTDDYLRVTGTERGTYVLIISHVAKEVPADGWDGMAKDEGAGYAAPASFAGE